MITDQEREVRVRDQLFEAAWLVLRGSVLGVTVALMLGLIILLGSAL